MTSLLVSGHIFAALGFVYGCLEGLDAKRYAALADGDETVEAGSS